jgi:hypothetical protein
MFHVCIYTNLKNEKFIVVGGFNEIEVSNQLAQITKERFASIIFNKLVIFKSFMLDEEGQNYLVYISKLEQKDLLKLVISENVTFSDQSKHLANH